MSFCEFAQLYINYSFSQLEINRVIQKPTEINCNIFRSSEAFFWKDWLGSCIDFVPSDILFSILISNSSLRSYTYIFLLHKVPMRFAKLNLFRLQNKSVKWQVFPYDWQIIDKILKFKQFRRWIIKFFRQVASEWNPRFTRSRGCSMLDRLTWFDKFCLLLQKYSVLSY